MSEYILPSPNRAETPLMSVDRIELSRKMDDIEREEFSEVLKSAQLCKAIIETDADLDPKNFLYLDGKKWYLPERVIRSKYDSPEKKRKGNGYLQFVCYVEENGILYPRAFYKSNSDGNWRAGIMRYSDNVLSKGEMAVENYTQTNKPCPELMIYLEGVSVRYDAETQKHVDNVASNRDWGLMEYEFQEGRDIYEDEGGYKSVNTFKDEVMGEYDDGGELKSVQKYQPGYFDWMSVKSYGGVEKLEEELSSIEYPKDFIPDFNRKPFVVIEYYHTLLGVIRTETYGGKLNGKFIEWNISYDKSGRVWIDSIVDGSGHITTYGTQKRIIQAGILNSKPLDYKDQLNGLPQIEEAGGQFGTADFGGHYRDFTPVLDRLKPIQDFRKARKLKRGRNGQDAEWPDISKIRNYFRFDKSTGQAAEWKTIPKPRTALLLQGLGKTR